MRKTQFRWKIYIFEKSLCIISTTNMPPLTILGKNHVFFLKNPVFSQNFCSGATQEFFPQKNVVYIVNFTPVSNVYLAEIFEMTTWVRTYHITLIFENRSI